MGHLGWTEREYLTSSPEAVYYALEGYFDKRKEDIKIQRRIGYNIWLGGRSKKDPKVSEEEWMPLSDEVKQVEPMSEERRRAIFERYNIKRK